ncbi:protein arginine N-methyltransferase 1-like isoform X2 [Ornithodoros turicata]|uniref:protein arginine N-methyltransferase 1-like isoform X2 n=1 Tax=Ornithodoros turicata TaxID=34597 RepID=UPI003139F80F
MFPTIFGQFKRDNMLTNRYFLCTECVDVQMSEICGVCCAGRLTLCYRTSVEYLIYCVCDKFLSMQDSYDNDDDSDWDEADEMEGEASTVLCLFCTLTFPSPEHVFQHCASEHNFDIISLSWKFKCDCLYYIGLINYIREHRPDPEYILRYDDTGSPWDEAPWKDSKYLRPFLQDDMLLTYDIEGLKDCSDLSNSVVVSREEYQQLQSRLLSAEETIKDMRKTAAVFLQDGPTSTSSFPTVGSLRVEEDEPYFESYAHFGIHHEMLMDAPRTEAYRDAMKMNAKSSIEGKIVLDVGCGTGILSMFAAECGAKEVFGVDQSEIAYSALGIVRENNLEKKVSILKGRLEDVDLPHDEVDIIVSEWMGYFLLFEGMMDTVLYARDKYLKPGGLILPDICNMFLVALNDTAIHGKLVKCWDNMWGFKMNCMKQEVVTEAQVTSVPPEGVCSKPVIIKTLDLNTCNPADCNFSAEFDLEITGAATEITALAGYFDCHFSLPSPVILSTSPHAKPTHWQQTVFLFEKPIAVTAGALIHGSIDCRRDPRRRRELSVTISVNDHRYPSYHLR